MKSRSSCPVRVEKNGVTLLIYRPRPKSGYVSYVVPHRIGGKRQRSTFSDLGRAKKYAKALAKKLAADSNRMIKVSGPMFYRVRGVPAGPARMALIASGSFTMGDTFNEGYPHLRCLS